MTSQLVLRGKAKQYLQKPSNYCEYDFQFMSLIAPFIEDTTISIEEGIKFDFKEARRLVLRTDYFNWSLEIKLIYLRIIDLLEVFKDSYLFVLYGV